MGTIAAHTPMRTQGRGTSGRAQARSRGVWLLLPVVAAIIGCAEETPAPSPDAAGSFLLDTPWRYESTVLVTNGDETVPFLTDPALLAATSAPDAGAPATADALDGSQVRFGADSRMLVQPPSFTDDVDFGARYAVAEASLLRGKLGQDIWFPWGYFRDRASGTLLLDPEPDAAQAVLGFISDVLTKSLVAGALDGAAVTVTDALSDDARVKAAVAAELAAVADDEPDVAVTWLHALLSPSGILDPSLAANTLTERLLPVVQALSGVAQAALADTLVSSILDANVVDPALTPDRVEKVIRFVLYREVLLTARNLAAVERVELELEQAGGS